MLIVTIYLFKMDYGSTALLSYTLELSQYSILVPSRRPHMSILLDERVSHPIDPDPAARTAAPRLQEERI